MKKKLKNNSFLIPSFLAGVTGLGYGKAIHSTNNDSSVQASSFTDSKNIKKLNSEKKFSFSKNDEIFDIIKNNLKNETDFKVDFGYTDGFHKSRINDNLYSQNVVSMPDSEDSCSKATIPYVIINPANGPSDKADYSYIVQIKKNKELGIKNLGYVTTDEYTKSIKQVYSEIDKYIQFYGSDNISGIFFDEVSSGKNPLEVEYMAQLYNYVKTKYPDSMVVANPGGTVTDEMSKYSDLWLTSELSADNYINHWTPRSYNFENNPENANRIVHVIHSADPAQYETLLRLSKERNAGFLMITTDVPNVPYEDLPQNFENLILSINNSSASHVLSNVNDNLNRNSKLEPEMPETEIPDLKASILSGSIMENNKTDSYQFNSFQKYSISGNLYISSIDLWKLLDNYDKSNSENDSKDRFDNDFNFGFNILNEFAAKISYKIKDKFGNFEIDLRKNWNVLIL
ncbi:spherulation-specific family 4 protein [Leptotrichia sp. oral taxon 223]|uniref:spherulation-specific family 4 protein n=1 Tax=Leptotrichia sp. oral taxon 223 TaxID=712363 RepID=UPI0015B84F39|nr:spherulation-specific family 4 protein [Leptotrichia sp. oral taxon 223]NWO18650.1 hypothetical protein [Leptotrichia sp. oral taxon 223]